MFRMAYFSAILIMEILLPHIFSVGINETKGFLDFNPTLPQFRVKTLIFRFILYPHTEDTGQWIKP